jgi:predicted transcriptional regulator
MMADSNQLSRRERQIMDILYARAGATVVEVQRDLPDPPTDMAVRRLMHILEEKGHVKRRKVGREFVYESKRPKRRAGLDALRHVLDTFFEGSLDEALAAHLAQRESGVTAEQLEHLNRLIGEARKAEEKVEP